MSAADSKEETDFESGKRKREDAEGSGLTAEDDATKKTKSEETSEAASNSSSFVIRIKYVSFLSFFLYKYLLLLF